MFLRETPGRTAMHHEDFVSVAIASNDRFDLLHRVIDAVHSHADMPYEIVISDDAGHRHPDLSAFQQFRDKVSRIVINTGFNQGLAVNANHAIEATRGRNVVFLSDDSIVQRPFMRDVTTVLNEAPYIGVMFLGQSYHFNADFPPIAKREGLLSARTPSGREVMLHCWHGASWANAFRKSYWHEVGGYSEDDIYGDLPFINKGWFRGYFAAALEGAPIAYDVDVVELGKSYSSVGFKAHGALCHYPRLFGVAENDLIAAGSARTEECAQRNHNGRSDKLNEFDCDGWREYMRNVTRDGVNWSALAEYHGRYMTELRRDVRSEP